MNEQKSKVSEAKGKVKTTKGTIDKVDDTIWRYLKKQLKVDEKLIYDLMEASCPAKVNGENMLLVRLFYPATFRERGLTVESYESLDQYPGLVLYEGYYTPRLRKREIVLVRKEEGKRSLLEEKQNRGDITDIGTIPEKTAGQKFLGGLGKFMLMGGFILILILFAVLFIVISTAAKGC